MAEMLIKMPIPYEPKMTNRWLIEIESCKGISIEIEPWVIHKSSRPTFIRNKWWKFWKEKFSVEPFTIEMRDPISPSTSSALAPLVQRDERLDIILKMLDPTGVTIEKWEIDNCKILLVDFGDMSYHVDELMNCKMTLKPSKVKKLL